MKLLISAITLVCVITYASASIDIFNFNSASGTRSTVSAWIEQSDTVRATGQSKSAILIAENQSERRAVFFSLLNPVNDAGFAGMRLLEALDDLSAYSGLEIQCRGQGNYTRFKIVLRHKGLNEDPEYTYEQTFQAPTGDFGIVSLPFSSFPAVFRGQAANTTDTLDTTQITAFGIQHYAGYYLEDVQQSGPATLEVDWVRAV